MSLFSISPADFEKQIKIIEHEVRVAKILLSECDKEITNITHAIELLDLPAYKTSQLTKRLKLLLKKRRESKEFIFYFNDKILKRKEVFVCNSDNRIKKYVNQSLEYLNKFNKEVLSE